MESVWSVLAVVWAFLNSPVGLSLVGSALAYGLLRLYQAKPLWQAYEGTIISAVRFAEKAVPDTETNAGLRRLDEALKYVLAAYEAAQGRVATAEEAAALREGIQIVHNDLELSGALDAVETQAQ